MSAEGGKTVEYFNDVGNELVVLGAALVDRATRKKLARTFSTPDYFLTPENARAWDLVLELERRGLDYDEATARRVSPDVDHRLLAELVEARPDVPPNLDFHVDELLWDRTKATALAGPLNGLLEALRDPKADRARIDALARQVPAVLARGGARLVRDARELQRDVLSMLDSRFAGRAVYPFGLDALDYFDSDEEAREAGFEVDEGEERVRRIVPGAAPAMITLISAMTKVGKTTFLGSLILGIARQRRRVLVASWEIGSKMSLEFLTELSLVMGSETEDPDPRFSRSRMLRGAVDWTDEMREKFSKRAKGIAKFVRFMDNPFYRRTSTKRATNEQHIDLFGAAIAESGAEVVVADLWSRMLTRKAPEDEETALFQQLAQVEELGVHLFMVTQQKHKEIMLRADKRPTAEGIKGSGAYAECATLMLGLHRPALFKKVEDNRIEVYCFDQRWAPGRWAVAVDFDPKTGVLGRGKSIPYDPGFADDDSELTDPLLGRRKKKGK